MYAHLENALSSFSQKHKEIIFRFLWEASNQFPPIILEKFREEYINYSSLKHTKSTNKSIKSCFRIFEKEFGSDTLLQSINKSNLEMFLLNRFQKQSKHGTALLYRTLKSAFNYAKIRGYVFENPFESIKLPKIPSANQLVLNNAQFEQIICKETDPKFIMLYSISYYTGMRLGEVIHMKRKWIDEQNELLLIQNDADFQTKSKKDRRIPFSPILKLLIGDILCDSPNLKSEDYIFYKYKGIKLSENSVSKRFKRCVRDAGLDDRIKFKTQRRSFSSNLLNNGQSVHLVKELLGHSSSKVTENHYSSCNDESLRRVMNGGINA